MIEKQIVADTTALAANAAPDKFDELAKRQKDAVDFANIYAKGLTAGGITLLQQAGYVFLETSYAVVALGACGIWALFAVPLALYFGRADERAGEAANEAAA